MNPAAMWLRSHPAERWGLTVLGALAVAVLLLVAAGRLLPRSADDRPGAGSSSPAAPSGAGPTEAAAPAAVTPAAPAAPAPTVSAPALPREGSLPDPASMARARSIASNFLVAYDSYRFTDGPDALRKRVRPNDTDGFDQQLARSSGAAYLRQQEVDHHQVATARVASLDPEGFAANGELGFVASVEQDVSSDQGASSQRLYYEVFLSQTPAGWRVDDVEI